MSNRKFVRNKSLYLTVRGHCRYDQRDQSLDLPMAVRVLAVCVLAVCVLAVRVLDVRVLAVRVMAVRVQCCM